MISRYERAICLFFFFLQNFMPGDVFVCKIRRKLWHPKFPRKVSRNGSQVTPLLAYGTVAGLPYDITDTLLNPLPLRLSTLWCGWKANLIWCILSSFWGGRLRSRRSLRIFVVNLKMDFHYRVNLTCIRKRSDRCSTLFCDHTKGSHTMTQITIWWGSTFNKNPNFGQSQLTQINKFTSIFFMRLSSYWW